MRTQIYLSDEQLKARQALPPHIKLLAAMSWEELDKVGKLPLLKSEAPEIFQEKFQERFGKDYASDVQIVSATSTSKFNPASINKSWDELDKAGELEGLKETLPGIFADKFEKKFGRKYKP